MEIGVQGDGVQHIWFRSKGSGNRVWGVGFRGEGCTPSLFRVLAFKGWGSACMVQELVFRNSGVGCRVSGWGCYAIRLPGEERVEVRDARELEQILLL